MNSMQKLSVPLERNELNEHLRSQLQLKHSFMRH